MLETVIVNAPNIALVLVLLAAAFKGWRVIKTIYRGNNEWECEIRK